MIVTVVSGKGGTGKTTIAAALAELERETVLVDCDVDAPNLYLYFQGRTLQQQDFYGGKKAVVDQTLCVHCGKCQEVCQFKAIENGSVINYRCEGCGACVYVCPQKAIQLQSQKNAQVTVTQLEDGLLVSAQMEIGSDGSGKLITSLRKTAHTHEKGKMTLNDGSPGIGCPVISSLTATDAVLIITEPTQSGMEDLKRVITLCHQLRVQALVCINRADINEKITEQIRQYCQENNLNLVGKIPFDQTILRSINELKPIVQYESSPANRAIREMWKKMRPLLEEKHQNVF